MHLYVRQCVRDRAKCMYVCVCVRTHACADVQQEKQHMSLLQGVENFDLKQLKQTDTEEKVVLPSAEGFSSLL